MPVMATVPVTNVVLSRSDTVRLESMGTGVAVAPAVKAVEPPLVVTIGDWLAE
ncbi:hypothetical protein D3C78_1660360 [compost metagenome]